MRLHLNSTKASMKRYDLQAIRGIAIILVLMFHLQPTVFPLGFVGVDIFFVLSGFLMAMILSKSEFSISMIRDFYTRRFNRIVPLMYVIILFVYIGCTFLLTEMDKADLKNDIVWSVSFSSNFQPLYEIKGYWDQISSYRFLVHCWSLGVEIQFYVFAPFMIPFANNLSPILRRFVLLLFLVTSLTFQLLASPKISYGLLPSRVWQFLLGCLCFEPTQPWKRTEIEREKLLEQGERDVNSGDEERRNVVSAPKSSVLGIINESLMTFVCIVVIFNWNSIFSVKVMRIFGTVSAAIVIKWPQTPSKSLLTKSFLVYTGDTSYVMYLIHWPIIVATKYYLDVECLDAKASMLLIVMIFIFSSLLHHTVEKFVTTSSFWIGFSISIVCLSMMFFSFPYYHQCCSLQVFKVNEINVTEAFDWNTHESKKVFYNQPCDPDTSTAKWTNYREESNLRCETKGNGTLKVLVIGNSMAYRAFPLIKKVLKGRYSELRLYSRSARPPLSNVDPIFTNATRIVVDKMRPDILWNIHVDDKPEFLAPFDNKTNDPVYLSFKENINFYKNRTKVFIIDLPFYWSKIRVAYEIAKRLHMGRSIDDLKVPRREATKQQEEHRKRIKAVECANCVYNDVEKQMYSGDTLYLYNPKDYHAYTGDGQHFTPEMLERLTPLYQTTIDGVIIRLQKNL